MTGTKLTIRTLQARTVNVTMRRPLATGGGTVSTAPLVLIDLQSEEGPVGRAYLFCYTARALKPMALLLHELGELIRGDAVAPAALDEKLQGAARLIGAQGFMGMAMAGIDMAAWDLLAVATDVPLVRLLGGTPRPIPAYNSGGLGLIGPAKVGDEAQALVAEGFSAIKVRLGYPDLETDIAVVRAVRRAVGDGVTVMSDYNQCLSVAEAKRRVRRLDDEGLAWIEEPTRFDDYAGNAEIRRVARTAIQIGENCWGPNDMAKALDAGSSDLFMPDAMKIGGVTGWMRAAALAAPCGMPVSSHLYPEISAHLLAVTPTRHWLEHVDWATPILQTPITVRDGQAIVPDRAGTGIAWNEEAVARFLV